MATTEQFSLRWNNFHSNLSTGFHDLFQAADMVDVTLAIEGQFLQAHKIVLSICSPYFKEMFKINPCKHPIVILKDISHENMKDILRFMYLGEVNVLRENLSAFLRTAELLQVKGLTGDDSSETSSRKDDKSDSIEDNDEDQDLQNYSEMLDQEQTLLPPYTNVATPQLKQINSSKRINKNASQPSTKRPKSDYNSNQSTPVVKQEVTNTSEIEEFDDFITGCKLENSTKVVDDEQINKDSSNRLMELQTPATQASENNSHDNATCNTCGKIMRKTSLRRHIYDVHLPSQQLPCDICHKLFKTANSLTTHLITIHRKFKSNRRN